jgi:hypothetical protein
LDFRTAGENGDGLVGTSYMNIEVVREFQRAQVLLLEKDCPSTEITKESIVNYMKVPLIQGVLLQAYIREFENPGIAENAQKAEAEGATFAAAVLPWVHACDQDDADIIYDIMQVGSQPQNDGFKHVKEAFERNYNCMGILCSDVGGLWKVDGYAPGASPCGNGASAEYSPSIVSSAEEFIPTSDLDQYTDDYKVIISPTLFPNGNWTLSKRIYQNGQDTKAPVVTIYGNSVFEVDAVEIATARAGTTFEFAICEAYFNDTKCTSCSVCGGYTVDFEDPWVVGQVKGGGVRFDCGGIVEDRVCEGPTIDIEREQTSAPNYHKPGDVCYYDEGAFVGAKTCFVDAPTEAPTMAPTSASSPPTITLGFGSALFQMCVAALMYTLI